MKKRILSIITSASLLASAFSFGAYAAPSVAGTADSAMEYIPMPEQEVQVQIQDTVMEETVLHSSGPSAVTVADSATELNTEFGTPDFLEGAFLMADLSGEGTEESPYLITSADDLRLMSDNINKGVNTSAYYKLTCNIDLGGQEWTPIGFYNPSLNYSTAFSGNFDGGNYTVSNFKITKANTDFIGFFGLVTGGTIKNLNIDGAVIEFDSSSTQRLYAGIVVGRLKTDSPNSFASITHCNVTDSYIKISSKGTIRAGGIAGLALSGAFENTRVLLAFLNADCDIEISTNANGPFFNPEIKAYERHMVIAGGIAGYIHAQDHSTLDVLNCSASGDVYADALNSMDAQAMSGGAFGDIRTVDSSVGGSMNISSCYSTGTVTGFSYHYPYVIGGFAGQIYPTKNLYVSDCYSSSDVNGKYTEAGVYDSLDPTAGGFVGQLFFENYVDSYGKTVKNCYGNGDVADLNHTESTAKDTSFVGGFTGWTTANVFQNCFRFESQNVRGSDIDFTDYGNINVLSEEDSKFVDKYVGFDMENTWQMDPEAEYFYPTLREKAGYIEFVSGGKLFTFGVFDESGKVTEPAAIPTKSPSVSKMFRFNYWSPSEDGVKFNFGSDRVEDNAVLYAVFTELPRTYTVSFINEGSVFGSAQILNYGSPVKAPEGIPEKPETERYYYEFLYWSNKDGGSEFDFTDCTVTGNMNFYAVYKEVDKTAWKGEIATSFTSGFGTEALPYVITSGEELALLAKVINEQQPGYVNAYYELGANINLGGNKWVPIGNLFETPFSGHFNGNGYTIADFNIVSGCYVGLFGYVLNGTITKLGVRNFSIELSDYSSPEELVYVGGLAGYTVSSKGKSKISEISVSDGVINVDVRVKRLYTGGITGHGRAENLGTTSISDCYASIDIEAINLAGYSYVGGIAGRLYTYSGSLTYAEYCYAIGSLYSKSYNSSRAGGLVGYLESYGSQYSPEVGSDSELDNDENPIDESAYLAADDDVDIMLSNSFAIVEATSISTEYNSHAGYIVADCNNYAGVENVVYPSNINLEINPKKEKEIGTALNDSYFKHAELLSESLHFDVENKWTFIPSEKYPVLLCMYSDKPILKLLESEKTDGNLSATLQVLFPEEYYTVIVGVYSERNQLLGVKRVQFNNTKVATEFSVDFENVAAGSYISVSAVEKSTLKPLHVAVIKDI